MQIRALTTFSRTRMSLVKAEKKKKKKKACFPSVLRPKIHTSFDRRAMITFNLKTVPEREGRVDFGNT